MNQSSVREAFEDAVKALSAAGIEDPEFEAAVLMEDLLSIKKEEVLKTPDAVLKPEQLSVLKAAAQKRGTGYPLQYIVGNWEFYGRKFFVGEGVLIPRQETELLCECVIKFYSRRLPPKIIDLCSGTGCIAVTLAKEINCAKVSAVELCDGAFAFLERNNEYYGACVEAIHGDALSPFGCFDCVVSNPPYVARDELPTLQKEVTFEPETAVFGGEDGLDFYRGIAENWRAHLVDGGLIAFEIGDTQGPAVEKILKERGYGAVSTWQDYAGLDRIVTGLKE